MRHPVLHSRAARGGVRRALPIAVALTLGASSRSVGTEPIVCWTPPLDAPVLDPFREPPCTWCPGNRGIEYGPSPGTPVRAVQPGVVTFAGPVVGVSYVVVRHPDGRRATYGHLGAIAVTVGSAVTAGQAIGISTDRLFFGLRDAERYVDPAPFLGRLVARPHLVPTDGSVRRPLPAGALRCLPA